MFNFRNVHSRSSSRPVIDLLSSLNAENVLLHAFDGSIKNAMSAIKMGYNFSIPPSFTLSDKVCLKRFKIIKKKIKSYHIIFITCTIKIF